MTANQSHIRKNRQRPGLLQKRTDADKALKFQDLLGLVYACYVEKDELPPVPEQQG